jgi:hypothetical protein
VSALTFQPSDELINGQDKMEVTSRTSILDNLEHWQVFNDKLETIIDIHDMNKKKKEIIKLGEYIEVNIESDQEPGMTKIGKITSKKERKDLINLVKNYRDVSHDEIKDYSKDDIQHTIPPREDTIPLKKKLREIYHKLAPMVQRKLHRTQFRAGLSRWFSLMKTRRKSFNQSNINWVKVNRAFDKSSRPRTFQKGDTVLLWDKRKEKSGKHWKFDSVWIGPYIIQDMASLNSFYLSQLDGKKLNVLVNGKLLKLFFNGNI